MAGVDEVEVIIAHHECATLRVGDVFLKIDADQTRTDREVEAMVMAPIPTPEVLAWRKPAVLALAPSWHGPGSSRRAVDRHATCEPLSNALGRAQLSTGVCQAAGN